MDDSQATALALALLRRRKRKRRFWVHLINQKRNQFGEYCHLVKELRDHGDRLATYFRMDHQAFDELVEKVSAIIYKRGTNYQEAIPVSQRLAMSLDIIRSGEKKL